MLKTLLILAMAGVLATGMTAPVFANDAVDLVKSPVSETVNFAKSVWEFAIDTIDSAEAYSLERIGGDVADATASCLHSEWRPLEGLTILGSIGGTTSIGGVPQNQLVGGATITVANVKGTRLAIGVRLVGRDISSRNVPLPEWSPLSVRYTISTGLYRDI